MDISSTDFNPSWTRLRGWSWVFLSSSAFPPPSATNFIGYQSGNASSSKSLSSCDIVSSVRRPSIWLNSVVRWVHPLVGRVYALPRVVISLFRDSDFEDLATGPLLSLGPMCGTLFRPKSDNRVTIFYSSRVNWKHFCSSSPEPFCGSISNEGPYKYSILLLLHCIVGAAPEYLTELCRHVNSSSGRHSLRSASRGDLIVPRFRLRRSGHRAFAVSGPTCGTLSQPKSDNRVTIYLLQFKSKLKTFLFQQSWALLWIHI